MGKLSKTIDHSLIRTLRHVATFLSKKLEVNIKSVKVMDPKDPLYSSTVGYNLDGDIRIRLRNSKNRHYSISFLVETIVHEVIHEIHGRHSKSFYKKYLEVLRLVRQELKEI